VAEGAQRDGVELEAGGALGGDAARFEGAEDLEEQGGRVLAAGDAFAGGAVEVAVPDADGVVAGEADRPGVPVP
jgi:hypothetical protein